VFGRPDVRATPRGRGQRFIRKSHTAPPYQIGGLLNEGPSMRKWLAIVAVGQPSGGGT
jgi:hypothetical protein